jgi:hypothetical protein
LWVDFGPWSEEDFRRISSQQGIVIQQLGLSDSEILHFLRSSGIPATFSTASVVFGNERTSDRCLRYWFLWVRCPACRTTNALDVRTLDRHRDAAVTSLIPALSCRSCRPNSPFAELVQLSRTSIVDETREEHTWRAWSLSPSRA